MIFPSQVPTLDLLSRRLEETDSGGFLLTGPSGIGKAEIAEAAIARLLSIKAGGEHPGLERVLPDETKASEPIAVDQVRRLICAMRHTSVAGRRRAGLIVPADAMTIQAANALLKTLEEPPAGAVIVLVAHNASSLPTTIRSRCQTIHCPPPDRNEAAAFLRDTSGLSPSDADLAMALANGRPGLAAKLVAGDGIATYRAMLSQFASGSPFRRPELLELSRTLGRDFASATHLVDMLLWRAQRMLAGDRMDAMEDIEKKAFQHISARGPGGIDAAWRICRKIAEDTIAANLDRKYATYRLLLAIGHGAGA